MSKGKFALTVYLDDVKIGEREVVSTKVPGITGMIKGEFNDVNWKYSGSIRNIRVWK